MPIDMSGAVKAPPVRKASNTPAKRSVSTPGKSLKQARKEGLEGLGQLGQGLCILGGQYADAATIGKYWPPLAGEVAELAETYEVLQGPVDLLIRVGPFGSLIALGMPMVMQFLANHGVIDAKRAIGGNIVPPEVLESQMRADIARMQAEAQREQLEAIREAQSAQAEYEKVMAEMAAENANAPVAV